jgi:hypothetical protein
MTQTPGADPIPLDEYEPLLLSTPEHFERYWPMVRPLIDKCVSRAMHGEITTDDVRILAQQQQLYIFIVKCDRTIIPSVKLAIVLEVVNYPRLAAMSILAMAGSDLGYFQRKYWKKLCGWAYMNGVRVMEGWVAPGMERMVTRYKFKRAYTMMRYDLTED